MKKKFKTSSKGFTLIELLIVIAILGILAAAVLIAINPGQRIASARNATVRSDLSNIGSAANIFNADTGLTAGCLSGGSYPSAWDQTGCGKKFMAQPKDPSGGNYGMGVIPAGCGPDVSGSPCTAFGVYGPAYNDGNVVTTTNAYWCWKSTTGTITQVASGGCVLP